ILRPARIRHRRHCLGPEAGVMGSAEPGAQGSRHPRSHATGQSLGYSDRAAAPRRLHRGRAAGDDHRRRPPGPTLSGIEQGLGHRSTFAARTDHGGHTHIFVAADGCGRMRAAAGLRERGNHPAGARCRAEWRDGNSCGARRQPPPADRPVVDGKPHVRPAGRCRGVVSRLCGSAGPKGGRSRQRAADGRSRGGRRGAAVRAIADFDDLGDLWHRTGSARFQCLHCRFAANVWTRSGAVAPRAAGKFRHRSIRRYMHAAGCFRTAREELLRAESPGSRLSARACIQAIQLEEALREQNRLDPGFRPEHVFSGSYYLPSFSYPSDESRALFVKKLMMELANGGGVESAGASDWLPFSGDEFRQTFEIQGQPAPSAAERPHANYRSVTPDYFRTLGVPLRAGRAFTERDVQTSQPILIVDETLARRFFTGANPLGRRVNLEEPPAKPVWREIVGVVGNVKHLKLNEPALPDVYVPLLQKPVDLFAVVVRTRLDAAAFGSALRRATGAVDPNQPVNEVETMPDLIARSMATEQLQTTLLGSFGAVALLLAVAGVGGVTFYSVLRQTREIGIRLALGAAPGRILVWVLGRAMRIAAAGVLLGVGASLIATRLIASILYGVKPTDLRGFVAVPRLLALAAVAATYLPARRAMRIETAAALRIE